MAILFLIYLLAFGELTKVVFRVTGALVAVDVFGRAMGISSVSITNVIEEMEFILF